MSRERVLRILRAADSPEDFIYSMRKVAAGAAMKATKQSWNLLGKAGEGVSRAGAFLGVKNPTALKALKLAPHAAGVGAAHEAYYSDTADKMRQSIHNFRMKRMMKNRQREMMDRQMQQMGG